MEKVNYIIITGGSKGIGEGIAKQLLHEGNHLIIISRTENESLKSEGNKKNAAVDFVLFDLGHTYDISGLMGEIFEKINPEKADKLILVNNAGIIKPIGYIEDCDPVQIQNHISINLIAPMILSKEFIQRSKNWKCDKRILNISSGAAQNPYPGWSSYCTGKAGIDMLTKCIAQEQEREEFPVKIIAISPGVIDTGMQTIIRSTTTDQFPLRDKFVEFKEKGQLIPPKTAGSKIAETLMADKYENGLITDIRNSY
ncbi:MAG: (S)-benzoin forming benzil reductase [Bacteroidales bacterium]